MENSIKNIFKLSYTEEVINTISHGVMSIFILFLIPAISVYSYISNGWLQAIGIGIFLISLFLMFITSTLYHLMPYDTKYKYIFRILDHSMIYIAIAGTYTPVALIVIGGWEGILIIAIQWIAVITGILFKTIAQKANPKFSVAVYLIMGWVVIFFLPKLVMSASIPFLIFLVIGGVLYSIGAFFYTKRKKYFHAIWHFFIIFAALAHMIAVLFFMV